MGKRIGLMLANLYQGSSISMWKAFAKAASRHKDGSFFVFPGGKLGEDNGDEYMRNDIFSLVTPESIDGVIIWTSALSGTRDASELHDYALEKSKTMPVVSMGMTIDGCTSVNFDAYQGLLSEIEHMITVHDDRRIAFLRGPETHSSAEARFRAYRDALGKHGIKFDPELVSSPFPWADGYNAMKELIEGRHLVPGKDFTALVAASDMLLLSASNYLSEHGWEIPRDLHAGGFNDSEDNILMPTEITTVRMPIDELASESFMLISEICEGRKAESLLLPSALVIRRSCGCSGISGNGDIHAFWNRVRPLISSDEALHAAREILEYMTGKGDDTRLYRYAEIFIASGGDAGALFDAASVYPGTIIPERKDRMHRRIVMEERRAAAKEKQRTQTLTYALDSFKRELLAARSKDSIPAIMLSSFRYLGIDKAFLMLYRDFSFTEFIGGFADDSLITGPSVFSRKSIVPEELEEHIERGTFIVEPLFYGKEELGYIVIGTEWVEGYVLEDIRVSLSSALRGISLLEDANKAKDKAERGERDAENFYARLSEGVMVPLGEIRASLLDSTRLSRGSLLKSVLGAEHLLELSLMERDELSVNKVLQSLSDLLSVFEIEAGDLPLIEADTEKIRDTLRILMTGRLSVTFSEDGVIISGRRNASDKLSLQYAERVILMHSGSIHREDGSCSIMLPYPVLGDGQDSGSGVVFSGDVSSLPSGLAAVSVDCRKLVSVNPHAIVITPSSSEVASMILSSSLIDKRLIIFAPPSSSLKATLERIAENDELTIAVFGSLASLPEKLEGLGRIVNTLPSGRIAKGKTIAIFTSSDYEEIREFRSRQRYSSVPVIVVRERFDSKDLDEISSLSNTIIVNPSVFEADGFLSHLKTIAASGTLPSHTGVLVKKAIVYLNMHAEKQISRWQVAESVNISEDYLARIFRREVGLSPWEYLGIFRIQLASDMLLNTGKTLSEIAEDTGFMDQAYFSRVFRKIKGFPPGVLRRHKKVGIVQ